MRMKRIKDIPEFSRPREKLKEKGVQALSDTELIAIILGSGIKGQDVRAIASKIARLIVDNKGKLSLEQLLTVEGIGIAKASQILAGFELARRYIVKESIKIKEAKDVLPLLNDIAGKKQEYFVCISLNGTNEVITDRAAAVIFAHNHPSGELKPSNSDLKIHEQLTEAGKIIGINVLDQIIISKKGYYSFQEEGLI